MKGELKRGEQRNDDCSELNSSTETKTDSGLKMVSECAVQQQSANTNRPVTTRCLSLWSAPGSATLVLGDIIPSKSEQRHLLR